MADEEHKNSTLIPTHPLKMTSEDETVIDDQENEKLVDEQAEVILVAAEKDSEGAGYGSPFWDSVVTMLSAFAMAQKKADTSTDDKAWRLIKKFMLSIGMRLYNNDQDRAEDLAQEICVRCMRYSDKICAYPSTKQQWGYIKKIVRSCYVDAGRRGWNPPQTMSLNAPVRSNTCASLTVADFISDPDTNVVEAVQHLAPSMVQWAQISLKSLPDRKKKLFQRRVRALVLFCFRQSTSSNKDNTYEEIGALLIKEFGVGSTGTAKNDVKIAARQFYEWREGHKPAQTEAQKNEKRGRRKQPGVMPETIERTD